MSDTSDQASSLRRGAAAASQLRSLQSKRGLCCLSVASGKGGVGKTFVSVNLSIAFAMLGKKVLLVDADLGLANADIVLGVQSEFSIQDALFKGKKLANVITKTPYGVDLLSASSGSKEMVNLGEARMVMFIKDLLSFASTYDVLLFDCAAGIDSSVTSFIAAAPQTLIVATPQPTSVMDVYALTKIIHQGNLSKNIGLIVNMAQNDTQGRKVADALANVTATYLSKHLDLLGIIPETENASRALHARKPLIAEFPHDTAAERFRLLAKNIVQKQTASTRADALDGQAIINGLFRNNKEASGNAD